MLIFEASALPPGEPRSQEFLFVFLPPSGLSHEGSWADIPDRGAGKGTSRHKPPCFQAAGWALVCRAWSHRQRQSLLGAKAGPARAERAEAPRAPHPLPIPPGLMLSSPNCPTWAQRQDSETMTLMSRSLLTLPLGTATSALPASHSSLTAGPPRPPELTKAGTAQGPLGSYCSDFHSGGRGLGLCILTAPRRHPGSRPEAPQNRVHFS